ncbi:hypothetical protein BGX21_009748 [Mortierella sp. AD011]|nr:hypothetical protein BGX20_005493 [Mortierella sp. AD010]KAF9395833.1 hypothetical protein BGX21_009748 [Mortierella sp. AD011]
MTNPHSSSSSSHILFCAKSIGKKREDGTWLFRNVDLEVKDGVLTVTGPSGVGTPDQLGIPTWRSRVMYIPQRTATMEGSANDFLAVVRKFGTHKKKDTYDDPVQIALDWGVRPELWHSKWSTLSGGEMQRISLAIGCSFHPDILLLDEPTSALDEESCNKVEKTLMELNCIWVTHNHQQAERVSSGGTFHMRGGDNSSPSSLSGVVVDED